MQPLGPEERREFQRLALSNPIAGTFGATELTVVEIGILGAGLHHVQPLCSPLSELCFVWRGREIRMRCEVVRTTRAANEGEPALRSGARFLAAVGDSGEHLRAMLADLVDAELELRDVKSEGVLPTETIDADKVVRGSDAPFLCYRFERGAWTRRHVFLPEQPDRGFTVAGGEDGAEMSRLCRVFEASDSEGRRLIRLFSELSVSRLLQIPPRA